MFFLVINCQYKYSVCNDALFNRKMKRKFCLFELVLDGYRECLCLGGSFQNHVKDESEIMIYLGNCPLFENKHYKYSLLSENYSQLTVN